MSIVLRAKGLLAGILTLAACGTSNSVEDLTRTEAPGEVPRTGILSSECEQATAQLRWDYDTVRRCESDSECNYVDGFYAVIPRGESSRAVTAHVCQMSVPFLVVANGVRVGEQRQKLLNEAVLQANACADANTITLPGDEPCTARSEFTPSAPPVCRNGSCQAARGPDYHGL
jgi:hypothetical protein